MIARLAEHSHAPPNLDPEYVARHRAWLAAQPGLCGGYHSVARRSTTVLRVLMRGVVGRFSVWHEAIG